MDLIIAFLAKIVIFTAVALHITHFLQAIYTIYQQKAVGLTYHAKTGLQDEFFNFVVFFSEKADAELFLKRFFNIGVNLDSEVLKSIFNHFGQK